MLVEDALCWQLGPRNDGGGPEGRLLNLWRGTFDEGDEQSPRSDEGIRLRGDVRRGYGDSCHGGPPGHGNKRSDTGYRA